MHDHQAAIAFGRNVDHRGIGEAGHVVDDGGAGFEAGARHRGVTRVDAHADALGRKCAHHVEHAGELLLGAHRRGAGTRRLPADVDDAGALLHHAAGMGERFVQTLMRSPVGERIGRNVQDAHQRGHLGVE